MDEIKKPVDSATPVSGSDTAETQIATLKSSNKMLKTVVILFALLGLLLLGAAGFIAYKLYSFKNLIMPEKEYSSAPFQAQEGEAALPVPETGQGGIAAPVQSSLTVFPNAQEYSRTDSAIGQVDAEKVNKIMAKYADRPIVKAFMTELKNDPDYASAMQAKEAGNPLAALACMQNSKGMQQLTMRYVMRKDFLPFLKEVMGDPEMKPLLEKLPMGNVTQAMQMLQSMPDMPQLPQEKAPATNKSSKKLKAHPALAVH